MTVRTKNITFINLLLDSLNRPPTAHDLTNSHILVCPMVKLQYDRIRFTAFDAGARREIVPNVFSGYLTGCVFSFPHVFQVFFMGFTFEVSSIKPLHTLPAGVMSFTQGLESPVKFRFVFQFFAVVTSLFHSFLHKLYSRYTNMTSDVFLKSQTPDFFEIKRF